MPDSPAATVEISAREFLETLWGDQEGIAELALGTPHPNDPTKNISFQGKPFKYPSQLGEMVSLANVKSGKFNCYYGVCLRKSAWTTGRGKSEDALSSTCLWADIDFKTVPKEKAIAGLKGFPVQPSIVISSGGGIQALWLLKEPATGEALERIPSINKGISRLVGGDSTQDLARVLRIPGTLNVKYVPPVPCTIVAPAWSPSTRYNLSDFDFIQTEARAPSSAAPAKVSEVDIDALPVNDIVKRVLREGLDAYIDYRKNTDAPEEFEKRKSKLTRSDADAWAVVRLLAMGVTDETIFGIYRDARNKIGEKYREKGTDGDRYLVATITSSRKFVAAHPEIVGIPEMLIEKESVKEGGYSSILVRLLSPFWTNGKRQELTVGMSSLLRRDDIDEETAVSIIKKVSEDLKDDEVEKRIVAVRSIYQSPPDPMGGSPIIEEALGDKAPSFFKAYTSILQFVPSPAVLRPKFPKFNFSECVPLDSFFGRYINWVYNQVDSPIEYHLGVVLPVMAGIVGNKCWTNHYSYKLFPTLYTMLVGPPALYRKSRSISLGVGIGDAAGLQKYPSDSTIERLYELLAPTVAETEEDEKGKVVPVAWEGRPMGVIVHSEFSYFLRIAEKSYMVGAKNFYTKLFDGESLDGKETKTRGRYLISDPAVSMICGVTLSALRDTMTAGDWENGLMSRFIPFIPPKDHQFRFDIPPRNPAMLDQMHSLSKELDNFKFREGFIPHSTDSWNLLVEFDKEMHKRALEASSSGLDNEKTCGSYVRLPMMAAKIALLFCIARTAAVRIEVEDTEYAVNLCRHISETFQPFFESIRPADGNRDSGYRDKVLETLRRWDVKNPGQPMVRKVMLQSCHLSADQLKMAVVTLKEEGRILIVPYKRAGSEAYKLNEKFES